MKVSVIVPALNEAGVIEETLKSAVDAFEVIVADGGSLDGILQRAARCGAKVISTRAGRPSRGRQMDAGADASSGDALLFLHADSILPEGWAGMVKAALADDGVVAGAFSLSIVSDRRIFRVIEAAVNFRASRLGLIYGDQAIFARREAFLNCGGFNKLPLMEDVDCVKRLRKFGRVVVLKDRVKTSARRWEKNGVARSTLRNWLVLLLWFIGVSPARLYGIYYAQE
ncbi:MAG: TIGR04283 family arsenosugar biosynthesis glycosyltransferase [Deltaproteobacteria bacterium]|nr:TIGR04283 family arsenosugar biosynthesis glycosyltransferase [Deltaproteobacteria bacterium]